MEQKRSLSDVVMQLITAALVSGAVAVGCGYTTLKLRPDAVKPTDQPLCPDCPDCKPLPNSKNPFPPKVNPDFPFPAPNGDPLRLGECQCGDTCMCGRWYDAEEFLDKHCEARMKDGKLQARFNPRVR